MNAGKTEYLTVWEKAIGFFEQGFFETAGELFSVLVKKAPRDNTAKRYAERCLEYTGSPPDEWDGIINLTEK
jgi:hypothetical protein